MNKIFKVAGIEIRNNEFLMVRKTGKDIWTNLGGKPESGETSEESLIREVKEELNSRINIIQFIGEFENKAALDDAVINIKLYEIKLLDNPIITDDELEEFRFIGENDIKEGINLPLSIREQIIPKLIKQGLLKWEAK